MHSQGMEVIMSNQHFAVLGLYPDTNKLMKAISELSSRFGDKLEAYTPYPVHGIEAALGIKKSGVGKLVLGLGLFGLTLALGFQTWVFTTDYQITFGGKPYFSWASFVPIIFEVTVLLGAILGAAIGMMVFFNRLPHLSHPILSSKSIGKITRDKFALAISVNSKEEAEAAREALASVGAQEVETVLGSDRVGFDGISVKGLLAMIIICVAVGSGWFQFQRLFASLPLLEVMDEQPKLVPQRAHDFFADGQSMLKPVDGTVSRGNMPRTWNTLEEASFKLSNPLSATSEVVARGQKVYETHCLVCHGQLGDGTKLLSDEYKATPANFHTAGLREAADGHFFGVMTIGKNSMESYSKDISTDDRWSVVHYIRVLQRSQNASKADYEHASGNGETQ
jgi:mono/diheme cytochrome c family protein